MTVDRAAWNMLVEGYCQLGLVETAKQVVERMKERGVQPDVATYGSLAKGIAMARKPGEEEGRITAHARAGGDDGRYPKID